MDQVTTDIIKKTPVWLIAISIIIFLVIFVEHIYIKKTILFI